MASPELAAEVESIKATVSKYFPVYDVRVSYDSLIFFISPEQSSLRTKFEQLRAEFKPKLLVPILKYSGGEYTLTVVKRPEMRPHGLWLNGALLVITLITTVIAGAVLYFSVHGQSDPTVMYAGMALGYGAWVTLYLWTRSRGSCEASTR